MKNIENEKKGRIKELIEKLNEASEAYYTVGKEEIMSNYEWDALFDELKVLEDETGYILDNSPTQYTGIDTDVEGGKKEPHEFPALSLAKSKDVKVLQKWAGDMAIWLSWKLDGLTLVITYDNGELSKLMTRGNGIIGANITHLAKYIKGIPQKISEKGHMVVRGEAVISYESFNALNETIEDVDERYANPRNLVSGTLNPDKTCLEEIADRNVQFIAFTLVYLEKRILSWGERMDYLSSLGFNAVEHEATTGKALEETIEKWTKKVQSGYAIPVDGLVIVYDDTDYAATGSVTHHHATNGGMAFKWQDVSAETTLDHIEWSCAVNCISPVAVFDPVQLEGTTVSRASLCNISEMKRLGIGANRKTKLQIIKANMIIPKCIAADAEGTELSIPETCPVCGESAEVRISKGGTEMLICTNPKCTAKQIKKYERFVGKNGMDIDGLSAKTITKFINLHFIKTFTDIYSIMDYAEQIMNMEGFGETSYKNLINALESSKKKADYIHILCSLSIPMIGVDAAKKIMGAIGSNEFNHRIETESGFEDIEGIGTEKSASLVSWFAEPKNKTEYEKLVEITKPKEMLPVKKEGTCLGKTFVITGDVHIYKNRNEFKAYVENQGGKVAGSVSKKTDYLVNNDKESQSSKNKTAKELGIPIISENEFISNFS